MIDTTSDFFPSRARGGRPLLQSMVLLVAITSGSVASGQEVRHVTVAAAREGAVVGTVAATGAVVPHDLVEVEGHIVRAALVEAGNYVEAGTPLAEIDAIDTELALAITQVPGAKAMCQKEIRTMCLRPWRRTPRALAACVERNRTNLSLKCQEFWLTVHMCQGEVKEICGGLDSSTVQKCLKESGPELSGTCQKILGID